MRSLGKIHITDFTWAVQEMTGGKIKVKENWNYKYIYTQMDAANLIEWFNELTGIKNEFTMI